MACKTLLIRTYLRGRGLDRVYFQGQPFDEARIEVRFERINQKR